MKKVFVFFFVTLLVFGFVWNLNAAVLTMTDGVSWQDWEGGIYGGTMGDNGADADYWIDGILQGTFSSRYYVAEDRTEWLFRDSMDNVIHSGEIAAYSPVLVVTPSDPNTGTWSEVYTDGGWVATIGGPWATNHWDGDRQVMDFTGAGTVVPIPGAIWFLGSGLIGLVGFRRKLRQS